MFQFTDEGDLSQIFAKYRRSHSDHGKLAEKHALKLDEYLDDYCAESCTKILVSYAKSPQGQMQPFGLGWQNHKYLCCTKLSSSNQLFKRKQFNIIKYKKKEGDNLIDSVQPVSCHLTQFHALFVYEHSVTVVSLITQQVVYSTYQMQASLVDISFDIESQHLVLVPTIAPVMVARLQDDGVDAWKQFLNRGRI